MPAVRDILTPSHHSRVGLEHLEQAVLGVLRIAGRCMGPAEISRMADIYRAPPLHDAITQGVLNKLLADGRVVRCDQPNGRPGWKAKP